jgi:hypothetical protein
MANNKLCQAATLLFVLGTFSWQYLGELPPPLADWSRWGITSLIVVLTVGGIVQILRKRRASNDQT